MRTTEKFSLSLLAATVLSVNAHAAGFQLYSESGIVALGNGGAGIAAEGFDASTSTYNPAALVLLKKPEFLLAGIGIVPNSELTGTATETTTLSIPLLPDATSVTGGQVNEFQFGSSAFVPAFHAAYPFNDKIVGALSVTVPFGLGTRYEQNTAMRYGATDTKVEDIDISPAIAFKVNDMLALGIGVDFEHMNVDVNSVIALPVVNQGVFPPAIGTIDYLVQNNGKDWGIGAHGGVLLSFRDGGTRLGLNYMSQVSFDLEGTSTAIGPGGPFISNTLNGGTKLPNSLAASFYHEVNKSFALLGTLVWEKWDVFQNLTLNNVATPVGTTNVTKPENYENAYRAALGFNYRLNDSFLVRAGGYFDETPVNDIDKDIRLPDSDRWGLTLGLHFDATKNLSFDVGYQHIFFNESAVNNSSTTTFNPLPNVVITQQLNINATADDACADLFGVQMKYQFG